MKNINYYVSRDNETKEIVYMEYNKIDGYKITPKTKKEDAIEVSKIVFVSPTLTEKLIKKKLELKLTIINNYLKYLGQEYANLSLKKLQLIINDLRFRLFAIKQKQMNYLYFNEENNEEKKGRGR